MPIKKGELAPFSGQLMTSEMALSIALDCDFSTKTIEAELERVRQEEEISISALEKIIQSNKKHHEKNIGILNKRLEKCKSRSFFEHPLFVSIVTATAVISVAYTIQKIK